MTNLENKLFEAHNTYANVSTQWHGVADAATEHFNERIMNLAVDLFDPGTVLDIDEDEYARGVVELVTGFLGRNSDDKEDVAVLITKRLRTTRQIATEWVKSHGTIWYDNYGEELREELEVDLTEEQLDEVANFVQSAVVTVHFKK
jgi:hypothetical protein